MIQIPNDSIDEEFPPEASSIYNTKNTKLGKEDLQLWKRFEWRRPNEIFQDEYYLFEGIDPGDIKQGLLGNCYFLSALSALAEFPNQIRKIFHHQEVTDDGFYIVSFFLGGKEFAFKIDDHIPYDVEK